MSAITIEYPASGGCGPAGCPPANGGGDGMFIITKNEKQNTNFFRFIILGGNSGGNNNGGGGNGGGSCTSCNCSQKIDCGFLGTTESSCLADGCLWCPSQIQGEPWCIHASSSDGIFFPAIILLIYIFSLGGSGGGSCAKPDNQKSDCGFLGITQSGCESAGCCWAESSNPGTPWCYHK